MTESLRPSDAVAEKAIASFLDMYCYPSRVTEFKRYDDRESQLQGKDVSFSYGGRRLVVDEKAQAHYVNRNLPTFAFEIDFIDAGGGAHDGWLFNADLPTECYLLIWPYATKPGITSEEDIVHVDCLLVSRVAVKSLLMSVGYDEARCRAVALAMRRDDVRGKYDIGQEDFYFFLSDRLAERPVNIVIRKNVLASLAIASWNVMRPSIKGGSQRMGGSDYADG